MFSINAVLSEQLMFEIMNDPLIESSSLQNIASAPPQWRMVKGAGKAGRASEMVVTCASNCGGDKCRPPGDGFANSNGWCFCVFAFPNEGSIALHEVLNRLKETN